MQNSNYANQILSKYERGIGKVLEKSLISQNKYLQIYKELTEGFVKEFNNYTLNGRGLENFIFRYLDRNSTNAVVFQEEEYNFLCMNYGLVSRVHNYFDKLVSSPFALDYIIPTIDNNTVVNKIEYIEHSNNENLFNSILRDPLRADMIIFLSYQAVKYVIFHELGHHYNGHVAYTKNKCHVQKLYLEKNDEHNQIDPLDYQTLEMDADACAITNSIDHIISLILNPEEIFSPAITSLISNPIELLQLCLFCIYSLFQLLDEDDKLQEIENSRYLPRRMRQIINIDNAYECIKRKYPSLISKSDFRDLCLLTAKRAETLHNLVFEVYTDANEIAEQLGKKAQEQVNKVFTNWKKIKPELSKYALVPLAD